MPKPLVGEAREIVYRVQKYFLQEKLNKGPIIPVHQVHDRVMAATGVPKRTVNRIIKEGLKSEASGTPMLTPGKHRRPRRDKIKLNDSQLEIIKAKVLEFVTEKNEKPSLRKLYRALREINVKCTMAALRMYIRQMSGEPVPPKQPRPKKGEGEQKKIICPSRGSSKTVLMEWLKHKNIPFSPESPRNELMELVKTHKSKPYTVDYLLEGINNGTIAFPQTDCIPKPQKIEVIVEEVTNDDKTTENKNVKQEQVLSETEKQPFGKTDQHANLKTENVRIKQEVTRMDYEDLNMDSLVSMQTADGTSSSYVPEPPLAVYCESFNEHFDTEDRKYSEGTAPKKKITGQFDQGDTVSNACLLNSEI